VQKMVAGSRRGSAGWPISSIPAVATMLAIGVSTSACANDNGPVVLEATSTPTASRSAAPTPSPELGLRDNPAPLGSSAKFSENSMWTLTMGATDGDSWPEIVAANEFNAPPPDGSAYVAAPVHLSAADVEEAVDGVVPSLSFEVEYVTAAGKSYGSITCPVEFPPPGVGLFELGSMYGGAEADFQACAAVPIADVPGGVWKAFDVLDPSAVVYMAGP